MKKVNKSWNKSSRLEQAQTKRVNKLRRRCSNSSLNHNCKIMKVCQSGQSPFLIMKTILNQQWQQLKCHQIHLISVKQNHLWWLNPPGLSLQNQNLMKALTNMCRVSSWAGTYQIDLSRMKLKEDLKNKKNPSLTCTPARWKCSAKWIFSRNLARPLATEILWWWRNRKTRYK